MKKIISFVIAVSLLNLIAVVHPASASTDAEKQARLAQKVKAGVLKPGTGPESKISVRLRDNTKLKGYVSEIKEADFAIADSKTRIVTRVAYFSGRQVKGHNLSTGAKVAIIALSIAAGLLAFFLWLENYD